MEQFEVSPSDSQTSRRKRDSPAVGSPQWFGYASLEEYGLSQEHIQTYHGNSLQHLKTHLLWLDERRACELKREIKMEDQ
jgi:hypothetical protein